MPTRRALAPLAPPVQLTMAFSSARRHERGGTASRGDEGGGPDDPLPAQTEDTAERSRPETPR